MLTYVNSIIEEILTQSKFTSTHGVKEKHSLKYLGNPVKSKECPEHGIEWNRERNFTGSFLLLAML